MTTAERFRESLADLLREFAMCVPDNDRPAFDALVAAVAALEERAGQ
jgi:hypothetical protein